MKNNKVYSWYIIEFNAIYKKMDKSFYSSGVTGIPVDIRWFFDLKDESNKKKPIGLWYNGIRYEGVLDYYSGVYNKRTRLFTKKFYVFNRDTILKYNNIMFSKINDGEYLIKLFNDDIESDVIENPFETRVLFKDGNSTKIAYYLTKFERQHDIREQVIKYHGTKCEICGFDFEEQYGALGRNFIDIHHIRPVYDLNNNTIPNPDKDFISICTNCHRMIHSGKNEMISPSELKRIIEEKEVYHDLFR